MGTFWAIVVAAIFVALLAVLLVMGARYLNVEEDIERGRDELDSSRNRTEDRGMEVERDRDIRRKMHGET